MKVEVLEYKLLLIANINMAIVNISRGPQWAAKGGDDSLGMKEWSDWPYILFLRVVWPKKSF